MEISQLQVTNILILESTMSQIYDKYKDEDGFLYMQYSDQ